MALDLTSPLSEVPGIGAGLARGLAGMGLTNVGRLVAHLPMRHERIEALAPIGELAAGATVSASGQVTATRVLMRGRKPRFEAVLMDGTGRLDLVWFHAAYLRDKIHAGARLRVQGKTRRLGPNLQIVNPQWWELGPGEAAGAERARLRPVYPATEGVGSRQIERAVERALPIALPRIEDHLDEGYRRERAMPALAEAYRMMHSPRSEEEVSAARRRLAYDELLLMQLGVALKRAHRQRTLRAPALRWTPAIDRAIRERLPFTLTPGQDAAVVDVARDLSRPTPANRLIQGDVGSGKTAVAAYAMLMAVLSDQQATLMAPTELLAEQHHARLVEMLSGARVRVALLTGSTPESARREVLEACASGGVDILVGTHALLTAGVRFRSLAVAVIDEQHRFGVHQRAALRAKAEEADASPHVLVMTATPIPRTLAITLFGDLDISTIVGLPPGRLPVSTRVVEHAKRGEVYAWVAKKLGLGAVERPSGAQAFVVAPQIGEEPEEAVWSGVGEDVLSEAGDDAAGGGSATAEGAAAGRADAGGGRGGGAASRTVLALARELGAGPLKGARIAVLHGRLKRETRDAIMRRFREGQVSVLVATTVIEVGVDVPGATIMVVEGADRFGLAQLHQLRGRVGRGAGRSVCVLIGSEEPATPDAMERLRALATTSDGFAIAEEDLKIRGPGEMFGERQAGAIGLRVADLSRDLDLVRMAQRDARAWVERSPGLTQPGDAMARRRMLRAHGKWLGLGDVG
ncbi:MAG: ATP-dependent DNA helicase RecG [Phycisphaerae bacterium]|nr:ATP-dependent DNA helicase RecG [Phycisphaerae bacterium]